MGSDKPQVTMIASYFASKLDTPGVPKEHAADAWREALYLAREMDAIDTFADSIATMAPDDEKFQSLCEDVQR